MRLSRAQQATTTLLRRVINIRIKPDKKSVSAKSLNSFKRQLQRFDTIGKFPIPFKSAWPSEQSEISGEASTRK